jgi:hypothetical protein
MERQVSTETKVWMDEQTYIRTDRRTDRHTGRCVYGRTDRHTDKCMYGRTDRQTNGLTDRQIN